MFKNLSIRYKISFIALVGFLGFAIYQVGTYRLSVDVRDQLQSILTQDFALLKFANQVQVQFADLDKGYQASLAEADLELLRDNDAKAMQIRMSFEVLKNRFNLDEPLFNELYSAYSNYVDLTSAHTAAVLTNTLSYERTLAGYSQVNRLREVYQVTQQRFIDERYKIFERQLIAIESAEESLVNFGLLLGLFLTALLATLSFFISRRITTAFGHAVNVAEQVASGNLEHTITVHSQDETGQLLQSLAAMRDVLKQQYEDNYNREKLHGFLSGLNELMRGDKSVQVLCQDILDYLAQELYAQHGCIYIFEENMLLLSAEYAKSIDRPAHAKIALGETLIGQAAQDYQARIITDLPDDYMPIGTGLGQAAPRSIIVLPVVFEEHLVAVLEIAAFHRFSTENLASLSSCNDAIAVALKSAQARVEIATMLEQSKEQTLESQMQRQALALANQQLKEKTEDLDRQRNQVLQKNRELEESRRELIDKSEALEQSGRYKSQFLSTMSHELRTPLNSILILSEALMDNRKHTLDTQDVQHAKVIHNAGGELLSLINDILDLSKVEEGKMEVIIEPIVLTEFAEVLTQQFEYQAHERGLAYHVNVSADLGGILYSDRQRVQQILKNFISNALKFTETGGIYIDIVQAEKEQCLPLSEQCVIFTVRDTGVGIAPEKQQLVFEAFKQADGTTSRKYGGTGLGLTISRELTNLLGGEIRLHSDGQGQGAQFSLLLPIGREENISEEARVLKAKQAASPLTSVLSGKEKILLIEDNPVFQQVLSSIFAQSHITLDVVALAQEGLNALAQTQYDCIISDLNLPDGDGEDLLAAIRDLPSYAETPIIVFTAEEVDKARRQAIMQYANQIANKTPQAVVEICQQVQQLLHIQARQQKAKQLKELTVLLVDDDARNLYSLSSILEAEGIQVIAAKSGVEALHLLDTQSHINVLLLDIMMPEIDGYEVLNRLRSQERFKDLPVIALTAKAMNGDKERCLQAGANAYLAKPIKPKALLEALNQFCD